MAPSLNNWKDLGAGTYAKKCAAMCEFRNPKSYTFFFCGNDDIAVNAWNALKKDMSSTKAGFFGFDALKLVRANEKDGAHGGSVKVPYDEMRRWALDIIRKPTADRPNPVPVLGEFCSFLPDLPISAR